MVAGHNRLASLILTQNSTLSAQLKRLSSTVYGDDEGSDDVSISKLSLGLKSVFAASKYTPVYSPPFCLSFFFFFSVLF